MKDVERYIDGCNLCQRIKNRIEVPAGKLIVNKIPERLWIHLTVDFITNLALVAEENVILAVCDRLSKMIHFVATTKGMLAKGLARLFRDNVWKLYRLLESMILNKRPQFAEELMEELNRMLDI